MGEVDVVFGIHIFFEIGKGHYYEITTIFTFFLSLGVIIIIFLTSSIIIPLLVYLLLRYSLLVTALLCLVTPEKFHNFSNDLPLEYKSHNNLNCCRNCVRGTRTQPLICVGCSVHYWVTCAINKGGFFEISFSFVVVVDTHLPRFEALA